MRRFIKTHILTKDNLHKCCLNLHLIPLNIFLWRVLSSFLYYRYNNNILSQLTTALQNEYFLHYIPCLCINSFIEWPSKTIFLLIFVRGNLIIKVFTHMSNQQNFKAGKQYNNGRKGLFQCFGSAKVFMWIRIWIQDPKNVHMDLDPDPDP